MSLKKNIVFLHPDLGIGGAERLVVDAAVGLQDREHKIVIFTSHCDPSHCFDEARNGTLDVRVRGNSIVPPNFLGRFSILCAILRQLHLVLQITIFTSELRDIRPDVFFVDQLSACVPLLRLLCPAAKILFYCHFPDKLLVQRGGWWKSIYRLPFDWLEQWTTGVSDGIVVNSKFTRSIFAEAFPRLHWRVPGVVYPCVDIVKNNQKLNGETHQGIDSGERLWREKKVLLSINRFERKKDVGLAIRAFAGLKETIRNDVRLVIAGGYDPRVTENVNYHKELEALATSLDLKIATAKNIITAVSVPTDIEVLFLLSIPSSLKSTLLRTARLLVYTPGFEHFGIVPLEAMLDGVPVLAANRGGPTETVVEGKTGWLRNVEALNEWTGIMRLVIVDLDEAELKRMGERGRERVKAHFSQKKMAEALETEFEGLTKLRRRPSMNPGSDFLMVLCVPIIVVAVALSRIIPAYMYNR